MAPKRYRNHDKKQETENHKNMHHRRSRIEVKEKEWRVLKTK